MFAAFNDCITEDQRELKELLADITEERDATRRLEKIGSYLTKLASIQSPTWPIYSTLDRINEAIITQITHTKNYTHPVIAQLIDLMWKAASAKKFLSIHFNRIFLEPSSDFPLRISPIVAFVCTIMKEALVRDDSETFSKCCLIFTRLYSIDFPDRETAFETTGADVYAMLKQALRFDINVPDTQQYCNNTHKKVSYKCRREGFRLWRELTSFDGMTDTIQKEILGAVSNRELPWNEREVATSMLALSAVYSEEESVSDIVEDVLPVLKSIIENPPHVLLYCAAVTALCYFCVGDPGALQDYASDIIHITYQAIRSNDRRKYSIGLTACEAVMDSYRYVVIDQRPFKKEEYAEIVYYAMDNLGSSIIECTDEWLFSAMLNMAEHLIFLRPDKEYITKCIDRVHALFYKVKQMPEPDTFMDYIYCVMEKAIVSLREQVIDRIAPFDDYALERLLHLSTSQLEIQETDNYSCYADLLYQLINLFPKDLLLKIFTPQKILIIKILIQTSLRIDEKRKGLTYFSYKIIGELSRSKEVQQVVDSDVIDFIFKQFIPKLLIDINIDYNTPMNILKQQFFVVSSNAMWALGNLFMKYIFPDQTLIDKFRNEVLDDLLRLIGEPINQVFEDELVDPTLAANAAVLFARLCFAYETQLGEHFLEGGCGVLCRVILETDFSVVDQEEKEDCFSAICMMTERQAEKSLESLMPMVGFFAALAERYPFSLHNLALKRLVVLTNIVLSRNETE